MITGKRADRIIIDDPVAVAAERLGATPADIPGLWNVPGFPELTQGQLLQAARDPHAADNASYRWPMAMDARVRPEHLRWSEPDSSPIDDIKWAMEQVLLEPLFKPSRCALILTERQMHVIKRSLLSKRAYRRWRGRRKAEQRVMRDQLGAVVKRMAARMQAHIDETVFEQVLR